MFILYRPTTWHLKQLMLQTKSCWMWIKFAHLTMPWTIISALPGPTYHPCPKVGPGRPFTSKGRAMSWPGPLGATPLGESTSMVWSTLGWRTAKEQNRLVALGLMQLIVKLSLKFEPPIDCPVTTSVQFNSPSLKSASSRRGRWVDSSTVNWQ